MDRYDDMSGLLQAFMADMDSAPGWGLEFIGDRQGGWYDYLRERWLRYLAVAKRGPDLVDQSGGRDPSSMAGSPPRVTDVVS